MNLFNYNVATVLEDLDHLDHNTNQLNKYFPGIMTSGYWSSVFGHPLHFCNDECINGKSNFRLIYRGFVNF